MSASASEVTKSLCADWVFSNNSNCSVAKDRGWFKTYIPFRSHLGSVMGGEMAVAGIGTVEIPVKLSNSHNVIKLEDVLHAPNAICNILGFDFVKLYPNMCSEDIQDRQGRTVACFDDYKVLLCLKLSGPPVGPVTGPSRFTRKENQDQHYYINVQWSDSERLCKSFAAIDTVCSVDFRAAGTRWEVAKHNAASGNPSHSPTTIASDAPYNAAEKAWLRLNYRGEYHFLQDHELSIHKEDDCKEGRATARILIAEDDNEYEDSDGNEDGGEDDFLAELETDPMSHVADYHFTEPVLIRVIIGANSLHSRC